MKINNLEINKKIFLTENVYKLVRTCAKGIVLDKFKPIVLNQEVIPDSTDPIIYAPNHRSTLDPFFLVTIIEDPIHWAALKRFFDGEDSIFNNSKNVFLRKFTVALFNGIGAIPIERGEMNLPSIREMNNYLKNNTSIGVFPEGTTNKNPEEKDIGDINEGIFALSKRNDAWIQPVSIVWMPKDIDIENKLVINFLEPFKPGNMSRKEMAVKYKEMILAGISENKKIIKSKIEEENINKEKIKQKVKERRIK